MKKRVIVSVLGLLSLGLFSLQAFAGERGANEGCLRLQENYNACKNSPRFNTKGDNCQAEHNALRSNGCPAESGGCSPENAIGNMRFCPDHRTIFSRQECHDGRWVWEDQNGGESNCPGHVVQQEHPQNCVDPDHSDINRMGEDRFYKNTTSGWLGSGRDRRYVTRDDQCVQRDGAGNQRLTEYTCINDTDIGLRTNNCPEGEGCVLGTCAMVPIVLNQCEPPANGWRSGSTYVLNRNLLCNLGPHGLGFEFNSADHDITIDCRGYTIEVINPPDRQGRMWGRNVFSIYASDKIIIKNCIFQGPGVDDNVTSCISIGPSTIPPRANEDASHISILDNTLNNFALAISVASGHDHAIRGNTLNNGWTGILLGEFITGSVNISDNRICNHTVYDLACDSPGWGNRDAVRQGLFNHIIGTGNFLQRVDNIDCPIWSEQFYQDCP